jgi:hypothetical protein
MNTTRKPYPTDLTDQEGQLIEPRLPKRVYGTKPKHHPRQILNALFYPLATSCPHAPPRLPPYTPVSYHFHHVSARCLAADLGAAAWGGSPGSRQRADPSTLIVDSQTVRGASKGGSSNPVKQRGTMPPKSRSFM